jgi:hypothetical protein
MGANSSTKRAPVPNLCYGRLLRIAAIHLVVFARLNPPDSLAAVSRLGSPTPERFGRKRRTSFFEMRRSAARA